MLELEINNLTAQIVDEEIFRQAARAVFEKLEKGGFAGAPKISGNEKISLVLVGEGRIRKLNKFWRGKNRATDVLAFAFKEGGKKAADFPAAAGEDYTGEIFICLPYAKKEAKRRNIPFEKELRTLAVHGILHIFGFDHERSEAGAEEFFKLQNEILK